MKKVSRCGEVREKENRPVRRPSKRALDAFDGSESKKRNPSLGIEGEGLGGL